LEIVKKWFAGVSLLEVEGAYPGVRLFGDFSAVKKSLQRRAG
jgi:hypothetical protein